MIKLSIKTILFFLFLSCGFTFEPNCYALPGQTTQKVENWLSNSEYLNNATFVKTGKTKNDDMYYQLVTKGQAGSFALDYTAYANNKKDITSVIIGIKAPWPIKDNDRNDVIIALYGDPVGYCINEDIQEAKRIYKNHTGSKNEYGEWHINGDYLLGKIFGYCFVRSSLFKGELLGITSIAQVKKDVQKAKRSKK